MGLHYFTYMGRDLENKRKWTKVQIINNANMNSKNIVNSVNIFSDSGAMNSILNG